MASPVQLYSYHKSSASWRIRIALNIKNIPYEYKPIRLASTDGDQFSVPFTKLNPSMQVPVLHIDGLHLTESVAIAEYLEETRPSPSLFPGDPAARAKIRAIAEVVNSGIQPKQNLSVLAHVAENYLDGDFAKAKKFASEWNLRGLRALEAMLQTTAGTYCVGDTLSFADCCLLPQVYSAYRFDVDPKPFETVWRIFSRLDSLPEFQAAHAEKQPDAGS